MTEEQKKTAGIAVTSLVLGVLSLTIFAIIGPLLSIPAIICGHIGMSKIKKNPDLLTGSGLALAGAITGYVQLGLTLIMLPLVAAVAIPSFVQARDTAQKYSCINNLRMIDAGKEQWALAESQSYGDEPDLKAVNTYLIGNTTPTCPMGGVYTYQPIGTDPECSVHGSLNDAVDATYDY